MAAMYCWGGTPHGELGLGHQEEKIFTPTLCNFAQANIVTYIACGENHTLFLTTDGRIYSCGNNDFGQLGHDVSGKRPQVIRSLETYKMTAISCGTESSLAINEWGQIFCWGACKFGQLGLGVTVSTQPTPKIIRDLAVMQAVQVASGYYHSVALMSNGDLYSWGLNKHGQLGLGHASSDCQTKPTLIKSLGGLPFAFIACGGYHTFAITKSGAVFGWGKNKCGQLGLNDDQDKCYPTQLKSLRSINICQVACGENFTAFLTLDGGVFTCGSGKYGQLGHGDTKNEFLPRKIMELMGSVVVQIACGRHHLIVATVAGRLQACGLADAGQLGSLPSSASTSISIPRIVNMHWQNQQFSGEMSKTTKLKRIFAGRDRCFATISDDIDTTYDSRVINYNTQVLTIDLKHLNACKALKEDESVEQDLLAYLETVFKSLVCLNASFLSNNLNHYCCNKNNSGVDNAHVVEAFKIISQIENNSVKELIYLCITEYLLKSLNLNPPDVESLRFFISIPLYHEMLNPRRWLELQTPLAVAFVNLKIPPFKILSKWYQDFHRDSFERAIDAYKLIVWQFLVDTKHLQYRQRVICDVKVLPFFQALEKLNKINNQNAQNKRIPVEYFYIHNLHEMVDLRNDYITWHCGDPNNSRYFLCHYSFLFDAVCKTKILEIDQGLQMQLAMNAANTIAIHSFLTGGPLPPQHVYLHVSRNNIVVDTIAELSRYASSDLKKPLKVKFHNEEAEDGGGVKKEFFMLLMREIFSPIYGMFQYYPESRCVWFAEEYFENVDMFNLIGLLCGLAIFNFTIINLNFPLALYKKLLGAPTTLEDLEDINPTVAKSLQSLLDYCGNDVEEVYGLYFEISREIYGKVKVTQLKENGSNIPVTHENKEEFVELYVDFVFNKSIEEQYEAFHIGFFRVCSARTLKIFQPYELMTFVIGKEEYNWSELEQSASYRGGYNEADPVIRTFWEVFNELSHDDKKKFLLFLTGSDRVPINGIKAIPIIIQPTNDDRFLPVAHTCFNLLDLPKYSTKEKLKYKLLQAIQQTEGFSLV